MLGNSHNHEQLSLNTASYVLVQSSGKIAQIVDTSHRDWWLVIDFFYHARSVFIGDFRQFKIVRTVFFFFWNWFSYNSNTRINIYFLPVRTKGKSTVLDMLGWFSATFIRKKIFVISCLLRCILSPFLKGVYSKRKEFAPLGSKFFPFRVDPFPERRKKQIWHLSSLKKYSFLLTKGCILIDRFHCMLFSCRYKNTDNYSLIIPDLPKVFRNRTEQCKRRQVW